MENTLKIKNEINDQEVIFNVMVNGTNDYVIKTNESGDEIIVRELSRERNAITFFRPRHIAGIMVKEIGITDEQLNTIEQIEKDFKQKAIDREAKRKENIINGVSTINVSYRNGKALSGYIIFGHEADLLRDLGVAKRVGGWRTVVDEALIEALGEEFTYEQASAYAKPLLEKQQQQQAEKEAKMKEAKQTGEKVAIRYWQEDCNNSRKNCDVDHMTEYALPDGRTKIERRHTELKE